MNAERLLELYDRVSDAPDAIPRLRNFILKLALRGKLVEQNPNDEPATELLKRFEAETTRLAERRPKPFTTVGAEEKLFNEPIGWVWTRLACLSRITQGFAFSSAVYSTLETDGPPLIKIGDIGSNSPEVYIKGQYDSVFLVEPGDLLLGLSGSIKCSVWRGPIGLLNQRIARIRPVSTDLYDGWLFLIVNENLEKWKAETSKLTVQNIKARQLSEAPVPLPPLVEQHRIVAKVDELMALCDNLEAEGQKREATRDRLTTANLSRLTAPDVEEKQFRAHADFAINVLPELTTRPDQIKRLRRAILDLAVRGKLVEQDLNDEPASFALARIAQSKKGFADASTRKRKLVAPAELTQIFHALPVGWSSAAISELVRVINGRAYKQSELLESGTPVLRVGNLFTSKHWYYSDLELEGDKYCDNGDIIYAWSASFGPFLWDGPRAIFHYHIWKLSLFSEIDLCKRFLYYFLLQKTELIKGSGHGISMVHMTKEKMDQIIVPFPPPSEQRRIVARVDELMTVCDQLEQSLVWGLDTRCCLLKTLLADALKPATIEAAYSSLTVQ